ncbi:hypothetical protein HMI55_000345 [Coelomomyces lativittatus]|nr:hypothetical protein HMI55_000345 [Coelomomyces lativittatus]
MGKSIMHWKEILPVQKYIAGVIGFLALETFINYLYFHYWNMTENPSYALLFLSALTNAGRISISFFILLIVSMGYGVVKPSLGKDMWKCQLLTAVHFFIGSIYAAMNLKDPRQQKFPILLIVIPLAMTMTVFYAWTLSSLTATTQHLETRRQHFKLQMYQRLWHILLFAGINLLIFFIFQSIWFAKASDVVFLIHWWRWRWMITDGWTNVLYTVCMLAICYLWRPTTNNARYGLEQVLSDPLEDEFDVDFSELYPPPPPSSSSSITKSKFTHPTTTHTTPPPSFHENTMFTLADSDDEPMQAMGSSESAPHYHRVQRRSRSNSPKPPGVGNMDPKLS